MVHGRMMRKMDMGGIKRITLKRIGNKVFGKMGKGRNGLLKNELYLYREF